MKICAIICEFNPFHNGHKYLLETAKELSGCDILLCIMSGSFTQRGDISILDKSDRARHAVLCGADGVIELPVAFAVSPAEIFAKGAIKILKSVSGVTSLAFGCENENADFLSAAKLLNNESEQFKRVLNERLSQGESYIKSYAAAFCACGGQPELVSKPNNILGVEYAKAILRSGAEISLIPIKRKGQEFCETEIGKNFSSAQAIRKNILSPEIKNNVPPCVYKDLKDFSDENSRFAELLRFKLLCSSNEDLRRIYGCGEGLDNKLLNLCNLSLEELIASASGKRYSESRIKRILVSNLLGLYSEDCEKYLEAPLYIKPLAIKKERAEILLAAIAESGYPLIMKQKDLQSLCKTAEKCFKTDVLADKIRNFIFNLPSENFRYPQFI